MNHSVFETNTSSRAKESKLIFKFWENCFIEKEKKLCCIWMKVMQNI